jgi:D-glycero-alpha-D-manno-heptose-7-phosphate kinase
MLMSKTPFRVSLFGGGSDLPAYYREGRGAVVSTAIDRYVYVAVKSKFDSAVRLSYSQTETVDDIRLLKHDLVRATLQHLELERGLEITTIADIPSSGTGMGSSSAFLVGLLNALHHFKGEQVDRHRLAEEACHLEIDRLGKPIGKQDQYAAAFGGFNHIAFHPDERVVVEPIRCSPHVVRELETNLMLLYTGVTRSADTILRTQSAETRSGASRRLVDRMVDMADSFRAALEAGSPADVGGLLDEAWALKSRVCPGITTSWIDHLYRIGKEAGAVGGKLLGAGGGGFILFYASPDAQARIRAALSDLTPLKFGFEPRGTRIVYSE